ncbi:VOC family protein [Lysobacter sp. K5869]|uniref:VOC family protein n=1 Tax=Lysobacter sp. K5869 TaxID=2820808 RepID=UPI001C0640E8|nr:VOC family protein [Lysobacter sp. K5869]QWP76371.1 VOC family protein [Lysobacter sp. K5869]
MPHPDRNLRLDYVEFNVSDIAASKAFYGAAFGWRFTDYGPDYCEFDDGRMKGGFNAHAAPRPGGALVVIYADDLADARKRVEAAGGQVVAEHEFPGGRRFHFTDPDGYELAVWTQD